MLCSVPIAGVEISAGFKVNSDNGATQAALVYSGWQASYCIDAYGSGTDELYINPSHNIDFLEFIGHLNPSVTRRCGNVSPLSFKARALRAIFARPVA
jgi:hypothetical protein